MVPGLAVVHVIQALQLLVVGRAEADDHLDDEGQHRGGDHGEDDGEADGLHLLEPEGLAHDVLEVQVQVAVVVEADDLSVLETRQPASDCLFACGSTSVSRVPHRKVHVAV